MFTTNAKEHTDLDHTITREIEALQRCHGLKQVLQLYDVVLTKDKKILVTDYMQGGDMINFSEVNELTVFDEEQTKKFAKSLAMVVCELHERGIIHRDIKLENIFMTCEELDAIPVIGDFGQSVINNGAGPQDYDRVGSKGYTAPEVLMGKPYDFKCDVFSMGCLLYALITANLPFLAPLKEDYFFKT